MDVNEAQSGPGFFLGLVLGLLTGGVAGVLWSPRSGAENRQKVAEAIGRPEAATRVPEDLKARLDESRQAYQEGARETRERMQHELDQSRKAS